MPSEDESMSDAELGALILGGWERLALAEPDGPRLNRRLAARFSVPVSEIEHVKDVRNEFAHSGKAGRSDLKRALRIIRSIERNLVSSAVADDAESMPSQSDAVAEPRQSRPDRASHLPLRPVLARLVITFNVLLTVLVLLLQGVWLYVSWRLSAVLSAWWNFVAWGSWEMPVGRPWVSMTGYYTVACGILLLVGWAMMLNNVEPVPALVVLSGAAVAVPALLSIPLLLMLVLWACVGLFGLLVDLITGSHKGADSWAKTGDTYLGFLGFIGYLVGTFVAIMSSYVVFWAWRHKYWSPVRSNDAVRVS